jgi:predicted SprT family Zn-dependent metalloprotease
MTVMTVMEKVEQVQETLARKGYPIINIDVIVKTLRTGVAGQAYNYKDQIDISKEYLEKHPDEIFGNTIPHEICHLYVRHYAKGYKQAHGPEFRRFMGLLGLAGATYHSMPRIPTGVGKTKTRFVYITPTGRNIELTIGQHFKAQRGVIITTKDTNEIVIFTGKQVQFK